MTKIGTTRSGKDVFDVAKPGSYKGFTEQDHKDAALIHESVANTKDLGSLDECWHSELKRLHNNLYFSTIKKRHKDALRNHGIGKEGI